MPPKKKSCAKELAPPIFFISAFRPGVQNIPGCAVQVYCPAGIGCRRLPAPLFSAEREPPPPFFKSPRDGHKTHSALFAPHSLRALPQFTVLRCLLQHARSAATTLYAGLPVRSSLLPAALRRRLLYSHFRTRKPVAVRHWRSITWSPLSSGPQKQFMALKEPRVNTGSRYQPNARRRANTAFLRGGLYQNERERQRGAVFSGHARPRGRRRRTPHRNLIEMRNLSSHPPTLRHLCLVHGACREGESAFALAIWRTPVDASGHFLMFSE